MVHDVVKRPFFDYSVTQSAILSQLFEKSIWKRYRHRIHHTGTHPGGGDSRDSRIPLPPWKILCERPWGIELIMNDEQLKLISSNYIGYIFRYVL
jgi:hypothetical protein